MICKLWKWGNDHKACRTRELSAELTVTRAYWRKQVLPVCGEILGVFRHACQKSLKILPHTGGFCLRQWSRVNFCSADSSRVRQACLRNTDGCTWVILLNFLTLSAFAVSRIDFYSLAKRNFFSRNLICPYCACINSFRANFFPISPRKSSRGIKP